MKFIRDIIAERSDGKPSASSEAPAAVEPETEPKPLPRRPDRTMTRLSDGAMLGADDVFKRLLSETSGSDDTQSDPIESSFFADGEVDKTDALADEDNNTNLFDDLSTEEVQPTNEAGLENNIPDLTGPVDDLLSEAPNAVDNADIQEAETPGPVSDAAVPYAEFVAQPRQEPKATAPAVDTTSKPDMVAVPAPASGRSGRGAGRVKTRLLGFGVPEAPVHDPFAKGEQSDTRAVSQSTFPVGWLVVTAGPGRGTSFALHDGVSQIGRGDDQAIRLDFGDTSISRTNHAAIAYDSEQGGFFLGHGGKANMVRLNDRPVLSTEEISSGAMIRIGETTLRFIAFCDGDFSWAEEGH